MTAATGAVAGTLIDRDGAAIEGARVTLTLQPGPATKEATVQPAPRFATSNEEGRFTFANLPPGRFRLAVAANGFASAQSSGELQPGGSLEVPAITLVAASSVEVQVSATQEEIAEAQINEEEKQRVFGVIPNFYVSYIPDPVPLTPKQKFELALKTTVDPVSFVLNGVTAGIETAQDNFSAWSEGASGYGKRYAAAYGTFLTGTVIGSAVLPIWFKQDPRYFWKGTGSVASRTGYALANAVICKGDDHHWQPNYSAILGGLAAAGISNAYYPATDRSGATLTFVNAAIGTGYSAISNLFQEFALHRLTPHTPSRSAATRPAAGEQAVVQGMQK